MINILSKNDQGSKKETKFITNKISYTKIYICKYVLPSVSRLGSLDRML